MAIFRNQATVSYNGAITNSNVVIGEITEVLSAEKNALTDSYQIGEVITYVVSLANSGTSEFNGLVIDDDLGAYQFSELTLYPLSYVDGSAALYINGVLTPSATVSAGPPLIVSGINIPAGGNAVLIYQARVTDFADPTEQGSITNTATVSGAGLSTPITAQESIAFDSAVLLSVTKSLSPVPVAENGRLTYTFVIENYGTRAAALGDDLVLTDTFEPILSDLTVTLNGSPLTEGAGYTYDETTGLFSTVSGQISIPAATVEQDAQTGEYIVTPGAATLVVVGTV